MGGDCRHCGDRGYILGRAVSCETPLCACFYILVGSLGRDVLIGDIYARTQETTKHLKYI